jgi:hypothetical protein
MRAKQTKALAVIVLLVALCVPMWMTAVFIVLALLWYFRDPICGALGSAWKAVVGLLGSLRGKKGSGE